MNHFSKNFSNKDNYILSLMTLITSFGDFLTFFAILSIINMKGFSAEFAGISVIIRAIGVAIGAITTPLLLKKNITKKVLLFSQFSALIISILLCVVVIFDFTPLILLYGITAAQSLLKQIFDITREKHSHSIGSNDSHMSLQSQIATNFYFAQVLGPITAYFLIKSFPIKLPLILDAASFLLTAKLCLNLSDGEKSKSSHLFSSVSVILKNTPLKRLFLLRSIGFWIGCSVFNFILFSIVSEKFKLDLISSAWIYSSLGLGAALAGFTVRNFKSGELTSFGNLNKIHLIILGHTIYAISVLIFPSVSQFYIAVLFFIFGGFGMGLNAISSQALRRDLTPKENFASVVGLESIVARMVDISVGLVVAGVSLNGMHWTNGLIYFACSVTLMNGLLHLNIKNEHIN